MRVRVYLSQNNPSLAAVETMRQLTENSEPGELITLPSRLYPDLNWEGVEILSVHAVDGRDGRVHVVGEHNASRNTIKRKLEGWSTRYPVMLLDIMEGDLEEFQRRFGIEHEWDDGDSDTDSDYSDTESDVSDTDSDVSNVEIPANLFHQEVPLVPPIAESRLYDYPLAAEPYGIVHALPRSPTIFSEEDDGPNRKRIRY